MTRDSQYFWFKSTSNFSHDSNSQLEKKKKLLLTAASSTYVCNFLQYKKLWKNWNHDQKLKSHNYDCISKAKALESLWLQRDSITIAITSKVLKKGSQNRDLDSNIKVF